MVGDVNRRGLTARSLTDGGLQPRSRADGSALFALRASISEPPAPVRIDLAESPDSGLTPSAPVRLQGPAGPLDGPGRVEEVPAAAGGTTIRAWLVLPDGASAHSRAPLLLWVHGAHRTCTWPASKRRC